MFTLQVVHLRSFKDAHTGCYGGVEPLTWEVVLLRFQLGTVTVNLVRCTFCRRERCERDRRTSKLCLMMRWHRWEHTPEIWAPYGYRLASKPGSVGGGGFVDERFYPLPGFFVFFLPLKVAINNSSHYWFNRWICLFDRACKHNFTILIMTLQHV